MTRLWVALLLPLLSGCGFQFGYGPLAAKYHSISIPYVEGDHDGHLTAELTKQISRSGAYHYKKNGGELTLKIKVLDVREERIGYRFDREDNKKSKRLVPAEGRLTAIADLRVEETGSGKTVLGPSRVEASTDYDHDYFGSVSTISGLSKRTTDISLGQLDDMDTSRKMAETPLYRALAHRIVEYLNSGY